MINTAPRYFSTNAAIFGTPSLERRIADGSLQTVGLAEAIITGQAPDGGLYMPTHFPSISSSKIQHMGYREYWQVFAEVMESFFDGVLSRKTLEEIAQDAYTGYEGFEPVEERISDIDYIIRLDEGPTAAFKDYAAQVLFRITEALMTEQPETELRPGKSLKDVNLLTYITATSGDTGGAMGHAILNRKRMWMAILHSSHIGEEVSDLQAKQMSTLGGNVYPLWIDAEFDGCQKIVQELLRDEDLQYMNLNSANSINIGRLLPQIAYYFYSYARVASAPGEIVYFSVPSGNFGNAVAGLFAIKMGIPIKLIVGVNENDVFERYFRTGKYEPAEETKSSPSNSMNINWPSNMRRLFQLYGGQLIEGKDPIDPEKKKVDPRSLMPNLEFMKRYIAAAYSISDTETHELIWKFYQEEHIIEGLHSTIEPHGAVAWGAAKRYRQETGYTGKIAVFETAHPGKFPESLLDKGIDILMPANLARLANMPHGRYLVLENDYNAVKSAIIQHYKQESAKQK
ncbi:MAG: threonine synthase [Nanoarchaeota archaeon]